MYPERAITAFLLNIGFAGHFLACLDFHITHSQIWQTRHWPKILVDDMAGHAKSSSESQHSSKINIFNEQLRFTKQILIPDPFARSANRLRTNACSRPKESSSSPNLVSTDVLQVDRVTKKTTQQPSNKGRKIKQNMQLHLQSGKGIVKPSRAGTNKRNSPFGWQ